MRLPIRFGCTFQEQSLITSVDYDLCWKGYNIIGRHVQEERGKPRGRAEWGKAGVRSPEFQQLPMILQTWKAWKKIGNDRDGGL